MLDQIHIDARIVYSCVREIANSRRNPPDTVDDVLAELERAGLVQSVAALRLVLSFIRDGAAAFAAALAARPAGEEPLTAARHALQGSILDLHGSAGSLTAYLAAMRLIDSTPTLLAAYLRSVHDHDDEIIGVLARREGVDPVADRRPRVLAAVIGAMVFLANKDWQASDTESPEDLAAAFDAYADAVIPALAGHWS